MFSSDKKFRTEITELEEKETNCKERIHERIYQFGKSFGVELSDKMIKELQGIMNLNSYHRNFNREKTILLLKKSVTPVIQWLLIKGKITNWVKKNFRIGD